MGKLVGPASRATHAILRIGAGLFFMLHGGQKLIGWFGGIGAPVSLGSMTGVAGVLELLAANGAGPLSIDDLMHSRKRDLAEAKEFRLARERERARAA